MHFLVPSLLLGLLAAVVPYLVHRIGHRRVRPVRFAALELLLMADRQISARRRTRDLLLLLSRTAIAAALPLVFARPFAEVRSELPASSGLPQSAVLVLDDSASLLRPAGMGILFDSVRARARALVQSMSPESDLALVTGSEGAAAPVAEPTNDRARIMDAIESLRCSTRATAMPAALRRAAQALTGSQRHEKHIYVITDLQAAGWGDAAAALPPGLGIGITVIDVSRGAPWENRALVGLTAEPAEGGDALTLTAEVANFNDEPIRGLGLTLKLDGAAVARGALDVPAGSTGRKQFLAAPAKGGVHIAEVELEHDGFPLDDRRTMLIARVRSLRVLLVDGDPRTVRNEDELFFLDAALRSVGSDFLVSSCLADDLGRQPLRQYSAVFLANVSQPDPDMAAALTGYVQGGGGLFVSAGNRVDAELWNRRLGTLLPQRLGLRRTAGGAPGQTVGETVDTRPAERLAPIDRRHPLLAAFDATGSGLTSARFFEYVLLEPVADAPHRRVVLRYESGAPALVEAEVGRGRVMLLTTTLDRDWTDLPIRPGFVALVQEAARRLAGAPMNDISSNLTAGDRREINVLDSDRRIEVLKPGGELVSIERSAPFQKGTVAFGETDELGVYRVRAVSASGAASERPDDTFVVNLDPRESNPARLLDDQRPDRRTTTGPEGEAPRRRIELWHVLGMMIVALLLLESVLSLRLRRNRRPPTWADGAGDRPG